MSGFMVRNNTEFRSPSSSFEISVLVWTSCVMASSLLLALTMFILAGMS